jgi:hypothetical protein
LGEYGFVSKVLGLWSSLIISMRGMIYIPDDQDFMHSVFSTGIIYRMTLGPVVQSSIDELKEDLLSASFERSLSAHSHEQKFKTVRCPGTQNQPNNFFPKGFKNRLYTVSWPEASIIFDLCRRLLLSSLSVKNG